MANTAKKKTTDDEGIDLSDAPEVDFSKAKRGKSRYAAKRLELPLSGVRAAAAKTQAHVASVSGIDQGDVSRAERRALDDFELRTLRRYLRALGAELELVAVLGASRIVLRDPSDK